MLLIAARVPKYFPYVMFERANVARKAINPSVYSGQTAAV
jgi:hypothetical protein